MTTAISMTASFDANLARHVGLAAAILYNILLWQSQSEVVENYDPDGWFYFTAKRFEALTTYSANWFTKASDKLVEVGLVEKKRMFRHDHQGLACLHFRVVQTDWKLAFDDSGLTQNVRGTHTKCDYNILEEKKNKKGEITLRDDFSSPQPSALGASPATPSRPAPIQNEQLPFGAEYEKVSVRPNKKETDPGRRPFAVGQQVLKAWGYKSARVSAPLANKFKVWLDSGFTPDQIIEAGELMKKSGDKYWETATPIQMVSENGLLWYQEHRKEAILKSVPHTIIGGRYYEIDPQTGRPLKEIKL